VGHGEGTTTAATGPFLTEFIFGFTKNNYQQLNKELFFLAFIGHMGRHLSMRTVVPHPAANKILLANETQTESAKGNVRFDAPPNLYRFCAPIGHHMGGMSHFRRLGKNWPYGSSEGCAERGDCEGCGRRVASAHRFRQTGKPALARLP
jgi:hypothetical protein